MLQVNHGALNTHAQEQWMGAAGGAGVRKNLRETTEVFGHHLVVDLIRTVEHNAKCPDCFGKVLRAFSLA